MNDDRPKPPFLVIRERTSFWVETSAAHEASVTLHAFYEGCFREASCYDATGGLWRIVNATLRKRPSFLQLMLPWLKVPVHLHLGPRTETTVEEVASRLAQVLRSENEFCRTFGRLWRGTVATISVCAHGARHHSYRAPAWVA
jgi:hypothetical protein